MLRARLHDGVLAWHLEAMRRCEVEWRGLPVPLATPAGRYPFVYPRDTASICRAYVGLAETGAIPQGAAAAPVAGAASFLLEAQAPDGSWGHRYDAEARDRSLYVQEDNVGHGVQVLAQRALDLQRDGQAAQAAPLLDAIDRALSGAQRRFSRHMGLYWSTTGIHESRMESGWTLWCNGVMREALRLALAAQERPAWRQMLEALDRGLAALVHDGRFVRRIAPDRSVDTRPDITLLSPGRIGFEHIDPEAAAEAVEVVRRHLPDPRLGLLRRHLPDWRDPEVHMHGGDGPYLSYTAWLAQHEARRGRREEAARLLGRIETYAEEDGLPEHVAVAEQMERFVWHEVATGRDLRKEFEPSILAPRATWRDVLDEAARMLEAYRSASSASGVARTATPHAWTHAECALARAWMDHSRAGTRNISRVPAESTTTATR